MEIERETVREIIASFGPLLLMIAVMVAIGTTFSEGDTLTPTGGQALVAAIVFFVFLMSGVGVWLARTSAEDDEDDNWS